MKTNASLTAALLLLICSAPAFAKLPTLTVLPSAAVHADFVTLGDIANISPAPRASKASARLAATVIGCAPLAGLTRTFTHGEITLKLRQAGIDPATVDIEGAADVIVTGSDVAAAAIATSTATSSTTVTLLPSGTLPTVPAHGAPVVKSGDSVDVVLADGLVTVHATGFATSGGGVGDHITIRRDGVQHLLSATIIGAGQVELEE